MEKVGVIYILTNPSFPNYVKIGYAHNIEARLKQLNRSETIPFVFRVYAVQFESCAIYKWSQYGGYQQWKQNQFESCMVYKGFKSEQDNAQVGAQVLFTRPPTLIPFAPAPLLLPFLTRNQ